MGSPHGGPRWPIGAFWYKQRIGVPRGGSLSRSGLSCTWGSHGWLSPLQPVPGVSRLLFGSPAVLQDHWRLKVHSCQLILPFLQSWNKRIRPLPFRLFLYPGSQLQLLQTFSSICMGRSLVGGLHNSAGAGERSSGSSGKIFPGTELFLEAPR